MGFRFLLLALCMVMQASALVIGSASIRSSSASAVNMMAKKEGKKVAVLLSKDAEGLSVAGDLVDVKPAYAENFLVARGFGVVASTKIIEEKAAESAAAAEAAIASKKTADKAKETINALGKDGLTYSVQVKDSAIEGTITTENIASELARAGVKVAAADITMPEVTELGSVLCEIALHPEVSATLKVTIEKSKISVDYS